MPKDNPDVDRSSVIINNEQYSEYEYTFSELKDKQTKKGLFNAIIS
jgi:hypothetical protein